MRQRETDHAHRRLDVDRPHGVERFLVVVLEPGAARNAGVVDEAVEAAELGDRRRHPGRVGDRVIGVEMMRHDARIGKIGDRRVERANVARAEAQRIALAVQAAGDGIADAPVRASHHDHAILWRQHGAYPFPGSPVP